MLSGEDILSRTISFLKFPLIVAVVFVHVGLDSVVINGSLLVSKGQFPVYDFFHRIIGNELARLAVPLFFFFSGFLFFYRSKFSVSVFKEKIKKRVETLLIPYLFWNTVFFILYLLTQLFMSSMTSGKNKLITDYGLLDYVNIFWNFSDGFPACYPFWFIRDLILIIAFTPLLYFLIKSFRVFVPLLFGVLWVFGLWFDTSVSITALFFFSSGAWYSISNRNFTSDFMTVRYSSTFIYFSLLILNTVLVYFSATRYYYLIHNIGVIAGAIAVVSWVAEGVKRGRSGLNTVLMGSSFFVYAYHGMIIRLMSKYWVKLLPVNEWTMVTGYFLIPVVVIIMGIGIYMLLRRYFPAVTALITGGRY